MICQICNIVNVLETSFSYIFSKKEKSICEDCINQLDYSPEIVTIENLKIVSLYKYNDYLKSILYRFKGQGDIFLAKVFSSLVKEYINNNFKDWEIITAPTHISKTRMLKFEPLAEVVKELNKKINKIFKKTVSYKQSSKKWEKRYLVSNYIECKWDRKLNNKNILILDDLVTSGNTLLAMYNLIRNKPINRVAFLAIARH